MATMHDQMQAGAALLDKALPNWWDGNEKATIDLDILDMNLGRMCILGQCFGDYTTGCDEVEVVAFSQDSREHGFTALMTLDDAYGELTALWKAEIKRRRAAE